MKDWKSEFDEKFKDYIKTMGIGQYKGMVNIGFKSADDVIKEFIENLLRSELNRQKKEIKEEVLESISEAFWDGTDCGGDDYAGEGFDAREYLPESLKEEKV